jgi:Holliday junction resolvase-like predicted endonuclease
MPALESILARTSPWLLVLGVLLVLAVGFWVGIRAARWVLRHRVDRTRTVGRRGEAKALKLLARAGYRVLERQVTARGLVAVDGEPLAYVVRADALAKRKGRRYVAEFKAGAGSATIAHRDTRRQVLEYAVLFDVDGVLLVDADSGAVHEIHFPDLP